METVSLGQILDNVGVKTPIIHNITNYVTVNDCANILLACGASPIMSGALEEMEQLVQLCSGLNINIGTLDRDVLQAMLLAGKHANLLSRPVVLDPVGVLASNFRAEAIRSLLSEISFCVIRGNASEIRALALDKSVSPESRGVDVSSEDNISLNNLSSTVRLAKQLSQSTGAVIVITGPMDIIADQKTAYIVKNGHEMMAKITGSGCMLSALITAYVAANPDNALQASLAAVCAMGVCGEKAWEITQKYHAGNSSYRNFLIDSIYHLDGATLHDKARYELA